MFGWEFPPHKTGGLGTACHGLTKGLEHIGAEITFVVPGSWGEEATEHVRVVGAEDISTDSMEIRDYAHLELIELNVPLSPYARPEQRPEIQAIRIPSQGYVTAANEPFGDVPENEELYGKGLIEKINEYTSRATIIAKTEEFDLIHAHDWMTFQAGSEAKKISGKPLIIHIHSTEYDRTGGRNLNPRVHDIERTGAREADRVIAVSERTRRTIVENYDVPAEKVDVIYNAVDATDAIPNKPGARHPKKNIVLFLGRITLQKGPDYFIQAASKVLEKEPDTMFVVAGNGDMMHAVIEQASDSNIGHKVLFAGFLNGSAVDRMYNMADVYVMPSVSEPFGIAPLEAMSHGVPVIISKQSGVSEVIKHALKVDFWDVDKLADRIVAVLKHKSLRDSMGEDGKSEVMDFSWDNSAIQCMDLYNRILGSTLRAKRKRKWPARATHASTQAHFGIPRTRTRAYR